MGFEYKIKFDIKNPNLVKEVLHRLDESLSKETNPSNFSFTLEEDGIYFCDFNKSERSSQIFRRLIDIALTASEQIVIVEL